MKKVIFSSDRFFQLWKYTVSQKCLLIWSTRTEEIATRIEILFRGVSRMELATTFLDLKILAVLNADENLPSGHFLYEIQQNDQPVGKIVARDISIKENGGWHNDASEFDFFG